MTTGVPFYIPARSRDLVFIDFETSGLDPRQHEIIEAAAVRTDANCTIEKGSFELRCHMKHPERASPEALKVNGYNEKDWRDAVDIRVVCAALVQLLGGYEETMWIGQNPHFDKSHADETFIREKIEMPNIKYLLDLASMAWPLCVAGKLERIGLDAQCAYYNVSNEGSHRAMADVRRSIEVYRRMVRPIVPKIEMRPTETKIQIPETKIVVAETMPAKAETEGWDS